MDYRKIEIKESMRLATSQAHLRIALAYEQYGKHNDARSARKAAKLILKKDGGNNG